MPYKDPEQAKEASRKRTAKWRKEHPEYQKKLMRKLRAKDREYGRSPVIVSLDDPKVLHQMDELSYKLWREARGL